MSWLEKLLPSRIRTDVSQKKGVPEGLWSKCKGCQAVLYRTELEKNLQVCPKCNHHHRVNARRRLEFLLDAEGQEEIAADLEPVDRLKFKDSKRYKDRISAAQKATGDNEALIVMTGTLQGQAVVIASFNFAFMGGSMGAVVGEKFVQAVNIAMSERRAFICCSTSGGARMQEGLISLMQMSKTSAALAKLAEQRLPYFSVLLDPTMGGVSASLAVLGDVIMAEPKALIGFAGPRVIEQTVRQTLPEGFQRSEFLLEHGHIDMIVDRRQMKQKIADLLAMLMNRAVQVDDKDDSNDRF